MEDKHRKYLFEAIDLETLRGWYKRLQCFRFLRAAGGHANDGDSLNAALHYDSETDLLDVLAQVGLTPDTRRGPEAAESLASSRPSFVPGTNNLRQPGHCQIGGADVFLWCSGSTMLISANPRSYIVEEIHVRAAEKVERVLLASMRHRILNPPGESHYYLCPQYYPDLEW